MVAPIWTKEAIAIIRAEVARGGVRTSIHQALLAAGNVVTLRQVERAITYHAADVARPATPSRRSHKATGRAKGNPSTLTPEVEAEMRRLWTETAVSHAAIAALVNARFGTQHTKTTVEGHAYRRAWHRVVMVSNQSHPKVIEERLLMRSFQRSLVRPADNPVRRVAAGTFPATGFTMIGGAVR